MTPSGDIYHQSQKLPVLQVERIIIIMYQPKDLSQIISILLWLAYSSCE
jgi:hypothetical protein